MSAPTQSLYTQHGSLGSNRRVSWPDGLRPSRLSPRRAVQILLDVCALGAAFVIAYLLRYDFAIPDSELATMIQQLPAVIAIEFCVLAFAGVYSFMWRYVGVMELRVFMAACFWTAVGLSALRFGLPEAAQVARVPVSVIAMNAVLSFGFVFGMRIARRVQFEWLRARTDRAKQSATAKRAVLLVGAGRGGANALRELTGRANVGLEVKGFIDDDPAKLGVVLQGVRVLGATKDIPRLARELDIDHVIVTIGRPAQRTLRRIAAICEEASIRMRATAGLSAIAHGHINASRIHDMKFEQVLGREPVQVEDRDLCDLVQGHTVMITGAGGSIGSELARQVARYAPARLLLVERAEVGLFEIHRELTSGTPAAPAEMVVADVRDAGRIANVLAKYRPSLVLHAAAHKGITTLELCPREAVRNNILAAETTARLAGEYGVERFVLVSTAEAARPGSVMAASKRLAEVVATDLDRQFDTKYVSVRLGNVVEASDSIVASIRDQIRNGGPVKVMRESAMQHYVTRAEAARLVLASAVITRGGEVFALTSEQPVSPVEVAENTIRLSGLRPYEDIEIEVVGEPDGDVEYDSTGTSATPHANILAVGGSKVDPARVRAVLDRLETLVQSSDEDELRRYLSDATEGDRPARPRQTRAKAVASGVGLS